jgi:Winged helix DNA-binding domain
VETVLSRRQLNRALLERQLLLRRERMPVAGALEHLVGLQCQVPIAPFHGLWSRLEGFEPAELSELVAERRAARMALFRWTQHLVTARDALALRPLLQTAIERRMLSSQRRALDGVDLGELAVAVRELLAERPMLASELGRALHDRWPDADPAALGIAAPAVVPVLQVPPRGLWGRSGRAHLCPVETWLGAPLRAGACDDLVRRYLRAFGPASVADMRTWSGLGGLRPVFERLRPELVRYTDERGRELFDVPNMPLPDPETPAPPRLLPDFDNALLGHDDRSRIVGDLPQRLSVEAQPRHVLVDGFLAGTWRLEGRGAARTVTVDLAVKVGRRDRRALDEEVERFTAFASGS